MIACLFFIFHLLANPAHAQNFNYWSMYSADVNGDGQKIETGANFFQAIFAYKDLNPNLVVGTQIRTSSDTRGESLSVLNPRVYANFKNIAETSWLSFGLQPFIEIPTTSISRGRTHRLGLLLAQNFNIKLKDSKWSLFFMTMTNAHFYENNFGYRANEYIFMPSVGYQLSPSWQLMAWAWFDWSRLGGTNALELSDWNDNYLRIGANYSVLKNVQIYPCVQLYTDNIRAETTTLGLELSAQI